MSLVKKIYYTACSVLPMKFLNKLVTPTTLLPYHHTVSDQTLLHIKHLYHYKNISQFTADLDYMLRYLSPVTPGDIIDSINKESKLPENAFLLTFDDGFKEAYTTIAPILEAKGVPAIFFINPAFIDNKELFYRSKTSLLIEELINSKENKSILGLFGEALNIEQPGVQNIIYTLKAKRNFTNKTLDLLAEKMGYSFNDYLKQQVPFLTTVQLRSLHQRGFTIGAHSWNHPSYNDISHEEQLQQTISSSAYVQSNFNLQKQYFSFPYSDAGISQKLFDDLSGSGIDLFFGIQNQKEELSNNMLQRFNAERPGLSMDKQLKGILAMMAYQKFSNTNKVIRKN